MNLRQLPGKKPAWIWTRQTGKLSREKPKGGIGWFLYHTKILIPKLLPVAQNCMIECPQAMVQEDKAPAHSHQYQQGVFVISSIQSLLWPRNSPEMNGIEPCWPWMKRYTTKDGAPKTRAEAVKAWHQA